jgi:hypothetical protein
MVINKINRANLSLGKEYQGDQLMNEMGANLVNLLLFNCLL